MAPRKRPEQQSADAERQPGQAAAQPTGEKVFSATREPVGRTEPSELTADEKVEIRELEKLAAEAYQQLGQVVERLSDRATDAYRSGRSFVKDYPGATLLSSFAVGVVLALLISKQ